MLVDYESRENRAKAVSTILKIRENVREKERQASLGVQGPKRRGRKPKERNVRIHEKATSINLEAQSYPEFLDFDSLEDLEPPFTLRRFSDSELEKCVDNWNALSVPPIPAHSQQIERCVGICSQVVATSKSEKSRDAKIRLMLKYNEEVKSSQSTASNSLSSTR